MKEQTIKYLNILLEEYQKGKSQLEIELANDQIKEERLEMNSELEDFSSKVEEVKACIEYISKFQDFQVFDFSVPVKSHRINPLSNLIDNKEITKSLRQTDGMEIWKNLYIVKPT